VVSNFVTHYLISIQAPEAYQTYKIVFCTLVRGRKTINLKVSIGISQNSTLKITYISCNELLGT